MAAKSLSAALFVHNMGRHRRTYEAEKEYVPPRITRPLMNGKVAPRSRQQFKVGPPFVTTLAHTSIYRGTTNSVVIPRIHARIDKGFDCIEGDWVGYKRNYFSLVATFELVSHPGLRLLTDDKLYIDGE